MNLVCDDNDVMAQADGGELLELCARPDASDGVVRAAEDEQLYLVVDDLLLEIREVDAVMSVSEPQGTVDERAPVLMTASFGAV